MVTDSDLDRLSLEVVSKRGFFPTLCAAAFG